MLQRLPNVVRDVWTALGRRCTDVACSWGTLSCREDKCVSILSLTQLLPQIPSHSHAFLALVQSL